MNTKIINTVLKAVAVAMGIAVVVLSVLGSLVPATGNMLLGLGLSALAVASLGKK
jgi:hypothetical protein